MNIRVTDTDFGNGPASADVGINGSFEGFSGVTFNFWGDSSNQPFGMGQLIYETSVNSEGSFLKGATVDVDAVGSLTFEANLKGSEAENAIGFTGVIKVQSSQGTVEVPNVVGDQQVTAEEKITDAGLVVGNVTTQASESAPAGEVISQSPDAGADVSQGARVNLVVSAGSAPEEVGDAAGLAGL